MYANIRKGYDIFYIESRVISGSSGFKFSKISLKIRFCLEEQLSV